MKLWLWLLALAACSHPSRANETVWILIPGGDTKLGCDRWPADYREGRYDPCIAFEYPRVANVSAFVVMRDLVVRSEYSACIDAGACTSPVREWVPAPSLPNEETLASLPIAVSFEQGKAFCAWVHGTLPDVEQWERLVRGSGDALYPWGDEPPSCERSPAYVAEEFGPLVQCKLETQEHYHSVSPVGARSLVGWGGEWVGGPWPGVVMYTPQELAAAVRVEGKIGTFDPKKVDAVAAPNEEHESYALVKGMWSQVVGERMRWPKTSVRMFRCVRATQPAH